MCIHRSSSSLSIQSSEVMGAIKPKMDKYIPYLSKKSKGIQVIIDPVQALPVNRWKQQQDMVSLTAIMFLVF